MHRHNFELCRQRRERQLDWELFEYELAEDIDSGADDAAYQAAWFCFLYGPCSKGKPNESE